MALKKNTKRTIIILSSLAAVIIIGVASGIINYIPITKSKNNTFGKSDKCFEKLKNKLDISLDKFREYFLNKYIVL